MVLIRIGERIYNLEYLQYAEDMPGGYVVATFETGRSFEMEGEEALVWKATICHYIDTPPHTQRRVSHTLPSARPAAADDAAGPDVGDCGDIAD